MTRVRTKITSTGRHDAIRRDYEGKLRSLVGQAANLVRNTAVESINQGAKTGITYEKYNPRRTHTASADGEPPATDTGLLVNNIVVIMDIAAKGLTANVESRADYSAFLEFGTSKMGARPFLQPALEENRAKIKRLEKQMVRAK